MKVKDVTFPGVCGTGFSTADVTFSFPCTHSTIHSRFLKLCAIFATNRPGKCIE